MSNLHSERSFKKLVLDQDLTTTETLFIKASQSAANHAAQLDHLKKTLLQKQTALKIKLNKLDVSLRSSLLSNKKFINETYALDLPITEDLFTTKPTIISGVLTPSLELSSAEKIDMDFKNFNGEYGTKFQSVHNDIILYTNKTEQFQQISIDIPKDIYSGFFYIKFNAEELLSVLNKNNAEIMSKTLTNVLKIPFDKDTVKIKLRFFDNNQRTVKIADKFFTKLVYTQKQSYETKPILVNKILNQIALNTCDNYSNALVNLKYFIKINNEPYKEIKPLNKSKISDIPNILKSSSAVYSEKLTNFTILDGLYNFPISSINNLTNITCLEREIREIKYLQNDQVADVTCYTYSDNPIVLTLDEHAEIIVNDIVVIADIADFKYTLPAGINKLTMDVLLFNQQVSLLNKKLITVKEGDFLTYVENSITKTVPVYNSKSICLQLLRNGCEIYERKSIFEIVYRDDIKYIVKDNKNNPKIFGTSLNNSVQSVQLKIELESLDSKTVPYVSSITLKGV